MDALRMLDRYTMLDGRLNPTFFKSCGEWCIIDLEPVMWCIACCEAESIDIPLPHAFNQEYADERLKKHFFGTVVKARGVVWHVRAVVHLGFKPLPILLATMATESFYCNSLGDIVDGAVKGVARIKGARVIGMADDGSEAAVVHCADVRREGGQVSYLSIVSLERRELLFGPCQLIEVAHAPVDDVSRCGNVISVRRGDYSYVYQLRTWM